MSRTASLRLNDALDRWLPPAMRDSRFVGRVIGNAMEGTMTAGGKSFPWKASRN